MENKKYEVNPDGIAYADIRNLIKVFSSTEYDSLEKAASEIIDNAIDAKAKHILVFLNSAYDKKKGKNVLSEIAFLDDGEGMSPGALQYVVGFGSTSRTDGGKIGKFGIGMNQASLFACKKFQVYSWIENDNVYLEEFDSEYIIKNNIDKAAPPQKVQLPWYIRHNSIFEKFCQKHGTLIVWSNFRENKMAKPVTIAKRMKNEFGRVYRYFLNDGDVFIYTIADQQEEVKAIDPMFLLDDTEVLGDPNGHSTKSAEGEPLFELFSNEMLDNGCKKYSVPYFLENGSISFSNVILKASVIKEKFYYKAAYKDHIKQPGDTEIGAYVKEFQKGITIVRNNREIDFNYFGFYDSTNQPQDRWFKLEVQFSEELDDAFHVSNNKQHVELKKISDSKLSDYREDDPLYPMWLRLKKDIDKLLSAMRNRNRVLANKAKMEFLDDKEETYCENDTTIINESLDDILSDFSTVNPEKNGTEMVHIEKRQNAFDDKNKEITLYKNNELYISGHQANKYYEDNNIIVSYEENMSNWITYEYDFKIKKFMICFNSSMLVESYFNKDVEFLITILCVQLCKENDDSKTYEILKNLLDKYEKYVCGGINNGR